MNRRAFFGAIGAAAVADIGRAAPERFSMRRFPHGPRCQVIGCLAFIDSLDGYCSAHGRRRLISIPAPMYSVRVSYTGADDPSHVDVFRGPRVPQELCYLRRGGGFCWHGVSLDCAIDAVRQLSRGNNVIDTAAGRAFVRRSLRAAGGDDAVLSAVIGPSTVMLFGRGR